MRQARLRCWPAHSWTTIPNRSTILVQQLYTTIIRTVGLLSSTLQLDINWTLKSFYSVSQKNPPPWGLVAIFRFQNGWEFFNQILHAYYLFLSTLDFKFLLNYLQLWRNYAILSVTIQFKSCAQNVHHRPKRSIFWHFPQTVRNF